MTMRQVKDNSTRPFVQIDIELISLLTVTEFKLYAQIKRRAASSGECWESLEHMAQETATSASSLKKAIKGLVQKRVISKSSRNGSTSIYELTPPDSWRRERNITSEPGLNQPGLNIKTEVDLTQGEVKLTQGKVDLTLPTEVDLTHYLDPRELDLTEVDPINNLERECKNLLLVNCPVLDREPSDKLLPLSTPPRLQISQDDDLESIVFELQGRGYEASKILYELKIRNKVPPYRTRFGSSSAIDKDFLQFIQLKHLQPLDCNKNRTVTIEDARSWITKRERDLAFEDILSKHRTFTETYLPEVVGRQLNQELERLHRSIELPEEWAHKFKTWYLVDLSLEQKQKYLTWLKEQPSENYAAA